MHSNMRLTLLPSLLLYLMLIRLLMSFLDVLYILMLDELLLLLLIIKTASHGRARWSNEALQHTLGLSVVSPQHELAHNAWGNE